MGRHVREITGSRKWLNCVTENLCPIITSLSDGSGPTASQKFMVFFLVPRGLEDVLLYRLAYFCSGRQMTRSTPRFTTIESMNKPKNGTVVSCSSIHKRNLSQYHEYASVVGRAYKRLEDFGSLSLRFSKRGTN